MKELDSQNRNLIYQLNIGDIIEMSNYRNTTIKGRIIGLDAYSKRSLNDPYSGIIAWEVLPEYQEITCPDIGFNTYIGWVFEQKNRYKFYKRKTDYE